MEPSIKWMTMLPVSSEHFLSHPSKRYVDHIQNMFDDEDTPLQRAIKLFHDIAKLKKSFQYYIRHPEENVKDKNHTLLSGYLFLLNNSFSEKEMLFGFLAIVSHHSKLINLFTLRDNNRYIGNGCCYSKELDFLDEVADAAKRIDLYPLLQTDRMLLEEKSKKLQKYLRRVSFKEPFVYTDFVVCKSNFASLIYSDKYEAIFSMAKEPKKSIEKKILDDFIDTLPFHPKRDRFRRYVLNNFDPNHRLFRLTAPTGYGKTLTALQFALRFEKEKIIFALPFTSIIDQTTSVIDKIFQKSGIDIFKIHHKTTIDESVPQERYSQVKFLMSSFSGQINITTLYQLIFTLFGNGNKENVKFEQLKNSVVIVDEAQAIPYALRKDFIRLCELVSEQFGTIFIFMSATMPVVSDAFCEVSDLSYFKEQNRYRLSWLALPDKENTLKEKIAQHARNEHTLCVVNTIQKAQELYLYFKDQFCCYALNGYMTDRDKQNTIARIAEVLEDKKSDKKILLISTQSIEAGVDLDFDVGFREVAPISSIIQTAGRVNRNFQKPQSTLYIFEDISGYSDLIYGDLQLISKAIFEIFKERDINESEILEVSEQYFQKIHNQLESYLIEMDIERLAFEDINQKVEKVMDGGDFKEFIVVEPYEGFVKEIEEQMFALDREEMDKFAKKDRFEALTKKLTREGVNVSQKDIKRFTTKLNSIKRLSIAYLPYGAPEYSNVYGIKKIDEMVSESAFD